MTPNNEKRLNGFKIFNIKRRAIAFLTAFAMMFSLGVFTSAAAGETVFAADALKSTLNPNESVSFVGGKAEITVTTAFGGAFNAAYMWLQVLDKNQATLREGMFETNAPARLVVDIPDGTYLLALYLGDDKAKPFTSYFKSGDIRISLKSGVVSFVESPVYANNKQVYSSKRTDRAALDYYLMPSKGIESDDNSIINLANQITAGKAGDYAKAKAIHDWVATNIWYDYDTLASGEYHELTATETLVGRKSVCQGFACLNAALLRAVGIPAKFVAGYSLGVGQVKEWTPDILKGIPDNHAWNEAFVDGRWVIIDCTWDTSNAWQNGQKTKNGGLRNSRYFDATIDSFSIDHKITEYDEDAIHKTFTLPSTVPLYAAPAVMALEKNYVVPESLLSNFDNSITRAELAAAFFGAYCVKDKDASNYKYNVTLDDITNSDYKNAIGAVLYFKIMKVTHGTQFAPAATVTNQEYAQMLFNLDYAVKTQKPSVGTAAKTTFADDKDIESWAKAYATYCVDKGYINVVGNKFNPKAAVTRQDALAGIYKALVSAGLMR